jgi:glycosyltransferase involved in cell wall biosynthesis
MQPVIVAQILLPGASEYERKCQRVDFAALSPQHQVSVYDDVGKVTGAEIAHVYGQWRRRLLRPLRVPYVESRKVDLPEAVEEIYFANSHAGEGAGAPLRIASFQRRSIASLVEQTMHRLHRTRDDIEWMLLERVPTPGDFATINAWIDPAVADDDCDGFVAEAMVRGIATVASRTPLNVHRLEKGRTGFLVPVGDANELTHAILAALFKPEVAQQKIDAARQTIAKFRARRRTRVLTALYESLRR